MRLYHRASSPLTRRYYMPNELPVDVNDVAKEMIARGIVDEVGWTNTLMDILEEKYSLESKVKKAMDNL
jgi:hypothetical protein